MTHQLLFVLSNQADNGRYPICRVPRVLEEFLPLLRRKVTPKSGDDMIVHRRLAEMPQRLEDYCAGPAPY